jgi:hypothetical protein
VRPPFDDERQSLAPARLEGGEDSRRVRVQCRAGVAIRQRLRGCAASRVLWDSIDRASLVERLGVKEQGQYARVVIPPVGVARNLVLLLPRALWFLAELAREDPPRRRAGEQGQQLVAKLLPIYGAADDGAERVP